MKLFNTSTAVVSAMLFAAFGTTAYAQEMMAGGDAKKTIAENAMDAPDYSTLVTALKAAGLVITLQSAGPFTVLAPTNDAFAELPAGTLDTMLKPENKDALATVLKCHVIEGKSLTSDISAMAGSSPAKGITIDTLGGCKLTVEQGKDGKVTVTDENGNTANVLIADVLQSNGVVHVIDNVLKPTGM